MACNVYVCLIVGLSSVIIHDLSLYALSVAQESQISYDWHRTAGGSAVACRLLTQGTVAELNCVSKRL